MSGLALRYSAAVHTAWELPCPSPIFIAEHRDTNDHPLSDGFVLSGVERRDKEALVEVLQDRDISRNTLRISYRYTEEDAEAWIEKRVSHREAQPTETTFAIRSPD